MRRIAGSPPANGRRTVKHDSATILDSDQPLTVRSFGLTERSPVRSANQDQFLIAALARALRVKRTSLPQSKMRYGDERGYLFMVADGVSGQQAGEEASALAVDLIERFVLNTLQWDIQLKGAAEKNGDRTPKSKSPVPLFFGHHLLGELRTALKQADAAIYRKAARHPELSGMGTTLTMAYSYRSDLFVAHVGDSRCYLFRKGKLHQLTRDHTVAEELIDRGRLPSTQAKRHWLRHMITNVVGGPEAGVKPELRKTRLQPGDVLLLCTDGLADAVPDDLIALILAGEPSSERACKRLVVRAKERGSRDDVTAIVARFDAPRTSKK